jgi:hypothetical protein
MKNSNLSKAKKVKNDEFYTQISDIEKELKHYKEYFKGKTVFLNCDDPQKSHFWKYFELNFNFLGIKRLISTHYKCGGGSYCLEIIGDLNGDGKIDYKDIKRTELKGNGDFRSDESIALLKQCDIVVTNPPFSLFREFISLLDEHKKQFLIIGNNNAITYKDCFNMIKEDKMWLGVNSNKTMEFELHSNYQTWNRVSLDGKKFGKVPSISWYTNLSHTKRNEDIILYKEYNKTDYPKYDNYDAINVDKVKDIPKDYFKVMGVPITFLTKYNPEQFEIVGIDRPLVEKITGKVSRFKIDNRELYARIVIKRKFI